MPVVDLFELLLDDVSDEQDLASAQKVGDARRWSVAGTNTIVMPLMTPGRVSGKHNLREKVWNLFAPRSLGCLDDAVSRS